MAGAEVPLSLITTCLEFFRSLWAGPNTWPLPAPWEEGFLRVVEFLKLTHAMLGYYLGASICWVVPLLLASGRWTEAAVKAPLAREHLDDHLVIAILLALEVLLPAGLDPRYVNSLEG
ncbi:hypothetical protein BJ742DRAFT_742599 [Cladochytrium replicatum]|nr:hypothetical protein BJ742DRAFT_742599 [Cladochytrium replicatum]